MRDNLTTIFIDTNVLLSPLKTEKRISVEDIILTLYPFKDSIIIPGHVYTEFYNNIDTVFSNSTKEIEGAKEKISSSYDQIAKQMCMLYNNERKVIEWQKSRIITGIEDSIKKRINLLKYDAKRLYDYFQDIFSEQTNDFYSMKEKYVLMAEYDARCKRSIAPGYKDSGKNNENDYGDLFIWQEILDYMHEKSKNNCFDAIFITNDNKSDWRTEQSKNQLQVEYNEYVFDGCFSVMSFNEFKETHKKKIDNFRTKYRKLIRQIEKEHWSKDDFNTFLGLIKTMDLSLTFFLVMLSEESVLKLNKLIQSFKSEILQLDFSFLSLSPRGQAALMNAGYTSIQKIIDASITEMSKSRCFGKMSLSEISEKRVAFNSMFGPFADKLETYAFEGYKSRKKRVSFD